MNDAHLHLLVNHLPIIFPLIGLLVLVGGFLTKSAAVKRTAYFIFVVGAIASLLAMLTGEGAEHVIKKIDNDAKRFIKPHEDAAELLAILSYFLGALSLLSFWASFRQKSFETILSVVTLLLAIVVFYYGSVTGTTGGEIKHIEIRTETLKIK